MRSHLRELQGEVAVEIEDHIVNLNRTAEQLLTRSNHNVFCVFVTRAKRNVRVGLSVTGYGF